MSAAPDTRVRLFCLPYAGGSAYVFRDWSAPLAGAARIWPAELPGRGARLHHEPLDDVGAVVDDLLPSILPAAGQPFAFLGYSYGALLAFELARRLEYRYGLTARHLFVAAMRAPTWPSPGPPQSRLPDRELDAYLCDLGGTPEEVLANEALMSVMHPIVRADLRAVEGYAYRPLPRLSCPVTALGGTSDAGVSAASLRAWRACTDGRFTLRMLQGGHFFLHAARDELLQIIRSGVAPDRDSDLLVPAEGRQ